MYRLVSATCTFVDILRDRICNEVYDKVIRLTYEHTIYPETAHSVDIVYFVTNIITHSQ